MERVNGIVKAKVIKIVCDSKGRLTWVDALPLALMALRSQANRIMHLTPHEMLTGRPMPLPYLRGPTEGPSLAQLDNELSDYLRHLSNIHHHLPTG